MILLTGATGFVGYAVLKQLMHQPDIDLAIRTYGRHIPVDVNAYCVADPSLQVSTHVMGEISAAANYAHALVDVDVVIHCAAQAHVMKQTVNGNDIYWEVNVEGTLNLARQALAAGVRRFIFISSVKVNGESTTNSSTIYHSSKYAPEDDYGRSKQFAEEGLRNLVTRTSMELVVIRPTLVYGPGVKANFVSLMNLVSKGIPLPFGCITQNKRSLVSITNLVDLIITCIDHPRAANQVFLVSDDQDVSTSEMVREMAKALDKPIWQLPIPIWCYKLVGKLFNKSDVVDRLTGSLQVDISHTKKTLGWKPPQTLQEGFKQTAQAFLQAKTK